MDTINLQVIRESFARVVYSHKTHEKAVEIQMKLARDIKWINILLLTITAGSILGTLITDKQVLLLVSSAISGLALGFSLFQIAFNPDLDAANHKRTALELWYIRERYVHLIGGIMTETLQSDEVIRQRDHLIQELSLIYKLAPNTDSKSYGLAQKALKYNEELTFSDKEIDLFLPVQLRMSKE